MLITSGQGVHTVDFVDYPLSQGTLLFVRAGQVQRWPADDSLEATLILLAPSALPHRSGSVLTREIDLLALDDWHTQLQLVTQNSVRIHSDMLRLKSDHDNFDASKLDVSLIRHEMLALLLRIAKLQQAQADSTAHTGRLLYRLFQKVLEANFQKQHSLGFYANRLACAESTLSRACLAAVGSTGKQVIDRRIALEAQRMLAHSITSIADIAAYLGFSEATNFVKFFRRSIGETPSAFRSKMTAPMNVKA
jgi:AraC-like DNA-binding protein